MDNQNNPNSSNNSSPQPTPSFDPGINPAPAWPSDPTQPTPTPFSSNTWGNAPTAPSPIDTNFPQPQPTVPTSTFPDTSAPANNWPSFSPSNTSTQSSFEPTQSTNSTAWTSPLPNPSQTELNNSSSTSGSAFAPFSDSNSTSPFPDQSSTSPFPFTPPSSQPVDTQQTPSSIPSWSPTPQPAAPMEATPTTTFSTPQAILPTTNTDLPHNTGSVESQPALSPLDNPWGSPAQPPAFDGSGSSIQPSWTNVSPTESAPTDLSHLISNNHTQTSQSVPETLVVPSANPTPEVPSLPVEGHKGIPKWLFGLGAGLLILVIAASAYFILGVGQPTKTTTSLPATIAAPANEPQQAAPATAPTSQPVTQPTESAVTGSANFGELQGNGAPAATSAADLLRQRQQGR